MIVKNIGLVNMIAHLEMDVRLYGQITKKLKKGQKYHVSAVQICAMAHQFYQSIIQLLEFLFYFISLIKLDLCM